ncbi:unnamed protein product [Rotaria sp. Silwood2]|nr:unnamed protein product [Rotaria sp. Silwood2]CAF2820401.1 unnamed protein product [Rotaria sp. Silwood2]CAF3097852.1 unnamed protein product [Rotaria sp. Silwood2]CAF3240982.1 unnamed protein product [Rotaria sp. Silwood2]CAF4357923.1 unnamed protein product [Rotaria sp. Silwood2]
MGRGYYSRLVRTARDWRNGSLTRRWTFDSSSSTTENRGYAGQGNHQISVGDVDADGKDEICNGASAVDDNGMGLYTNRKGHGDVLHMTDIDPDRLGQEVWQCYESTNSYGQYGLALHDGKTGEFIWGIPISGDIGRAMAADIDPRYKGLEVWGAFGGLYNCKCTQTAPNRPSMNFGVWWDGDLSRELLDRTVLDKWDYSRNTTSRLYTFYQRGNATSSNGS